MAKPYLQSAYRYKADYRDSLVIHYQILNFIKKAQSTTNTKMTGKTRITFSCRLSQVQFKEHMKFLIEHELVEQKIQSIVTGPGKRIRKRGPHRSTIYYTITEKGIKYAEIVEKMKALFEKDTKHFIFPEKLDEVF